MATTFTARAAIKATGIASLNDLTFTASGTCVGNSDVVDDTQDIGTTTEAITTGEIAAGSCKYLLIVNLDSTNFVTLGYASPVVPGTNTFHLEPGGIALLPTPSGALNAIADTATVKILKRAVTK